MLSSSLFRTASLTGLCRRCKSTQQLASQRRIQGGRFGLRGHIAIRLVVWEMAQGLHSRLKLNTESDLQTLMAKNSHRRLLLHLPRDSVVLFRAVIGLERVLSLYTNLGRYATVQIGLKWATSDFRYLREHREIISLCFQSFLILERT